MKRILLLLTLFVTFLTASSQTYTLCEKWVDCGNGCKLLDPYYSEGVTFEWTGASKDQKANGYGIAKKYVNGIYESTYEGEYKNGIRAGKGRFIHKDGTTRYGTFVDGQLMGYGTMESDNGDSYEGNFINYRCHGNGKVRWGNGSTFEGFMVSDRPYTGKYTHYDGSITYIQKGEIVDRISPTKNNYTPKIGQRLTEYMDENWQHCSPKEASYYRIITYVAPHIPKGVVKDYYMSGELQGEGSFIYVDYEDDGKNFTEGEIKTYYKSGQLKSHMIYLNNKPNGPYVAYYENGHKKTESFFRYGILEGTSSDYYENGNVATIRRFEKGELRNNKYLQFSEDNEDCFLIYDEDFKKNEKHWQYHGANGELSVETKYNVAFSVTPDRTVSGGIFANFSPDYNGLIDVTFKRDISSENIAIGALIGFKDWDNYCGFLIRGKAYTFFQLRNGKMITNSDWKYFSAIEPEQNSLRIVHMGSQLTLVINDEIIESIARPNYSGHFLCLTVVNSSPVMAKVQAGALSLCELVTDENQIKEYLPAINPSVDEWISSGSGFFIDKRGYIATNYHVIEDGKTIQATFIRDGKVEHWPVKVILSDKQNDLAILEIDSPQFPPMPDIPYALTTSVKDTGSEVFTLGYPMADIMGEEVKFTDGKISSKTGIQGDVTVYQISVPIQPGNSGGPLFDAKGDVVGITSSGLNRDYFKAENVNYAIKSSYLKALIDAMPTPLALLKGIGIADLPLTEKIKKIQPFVVYLQVR